MPELTEVKFDPFFGGFVLETLTIGMYGEARNAIREYVQNGFDSIQRAVEDGLLQPGEGHIDIRLAADKKSLVIRDNGTGLPARSATAVLTRVGASLKSYRKNAGFRGIGRLAGIVFANTVTFVTKAKGESLETTVIFDGKSMRAGMAPARGSTKSADQLLRETVRAFTSAAKDVERHYFEVRLEGLVDPPKECISFHEMYDFVSQVAPAPYRNDFPFADEIRAAATENGMPIEEVRITLSEGGGQPQDLCKRYGATYRFESGEISLSRIAFHRSPSKRWWAWVGHKAESGAYTDAKVSGLRVRVRNIQIDGAELFREIFGLYAAKTHIRFQDYYVGEVFIDPSALVPNARRDGFEEDPAWKKVRTELGSVAKKLGQDAYAVSNAGQLSVEAQQENLTNARKELRQLERTDFVDQDRIVKLSNNLTTWQKRIAKAAKDADLATSARLQAIGAEFSDIKRLAMSKMTGEASSLDREQVQQDARDAFAREIMQLLEQGLSPPCVAEARTILEPYLGEDAT